MSYLSSTIISWPASSLWQNGAPFTLCTLQRASMSRPILNDFCWGTFSTDSFHFLPFPSSLSPSLAPFLPLLLLWAELGEGWAALWDLYIWLDLYSKTPKLLCCHMTLNWPCNLKERERRGEKNRSHSWGNDQTRQSVKPYKPGHKWNIHKV